MRKYRGILFPVVFLLISTGVSACKVSDDILWVGIESINWETELPTIEYSLVENTTRFTFNGNGTFNNPDNNDYRIVHRDGCGFKPTVKYTPDNLIENPIEGTNFFSLRCFQELMPIEYHKSKTTFEIYGGIEFVGNLSTLPLGFYDISIDVYPPYDEKIENINYLVQADGNVVVVQMRNYCAEPEVTTTTQEVTLTGEIDFMISPVVIALALTYQLKKSKK